jgi:hypothetical protein
MMYEDTLEKPKNAIRRAMRRRGQKQVNFTEPTYRDAPQYDYSSDEEEGAENGEATENGSNEEEVARNGADNPQDDDEITATTAATVKTNGAPAVQPPAQQNPLDEDNDMEPRPSDEYVDRGK